MKINLFNEPKNAIVFAYLCYIKEDYAYNIAKEFEKAIKDKKWNKESLKVNSYLQNASKMSVILNELEKGQLVTSHILKNYPDRKYYSINFDVFVSDFILEKQTIKIPQGSWSNTKEIKVTPDQLKSYINYFLDKIFPEPEDYEKVIEGLNRWKKFDFYMILTILLFNFERYMTELTEKTIKTMEEKKQPDNEISSLLIKLNFVMTYFSAYKDLIDLRSYRDDFKLLIKRKYIQRVEQYSRLSKLERINSEQNINSELNEVVELVSEILVSAILKSSQSIDLTEPAISKWYEDQSAKVPKLPTSPPSTPPAAPSKSAEEEAMKIMKEMEIAAKEVEAAEKLPTPPPKPPETDTNE